MSNVRDFWRAVAPVALICLGAAAQTNDVTRIDTVAGGQGAGNSAISTPLVKPVAVAVAPGGQGLFLAEVTPAASLIRFVNTGPAPLRVAGLDVAPGALVTLAGGGASTQENIPGGQADLGGVAGLAASADGKLLYFIDATAIRIRALNVSPEPVTLAGGSLSPGHVRTLATAAAGFGMQLSGLAVDYLTGNLFAVDATVLVNKVFKITPGGVVSVVAGNGATSRPDDPLTPGPATSVPLLQPRAIALDDGGNLFVADSGHGRIIRVSPGGDATLAAQYGTRGSNPFPSGLAFYNRDLYAAMGIDQTIVKVTGGQGPLAGRAGEACDYPPGSSCGDGGPLSGARLNLLSSISSPPLAGIAGDGNGLFVLDQGDTGRGRVRYLNVSLQPRTVAGVPIPGGQVATVAGSGLEYPYDGGPAPSAALSEPGGVVADAANNLYIADTLNNRLRFVNRGANQVTIFAGTPAAQIVAPGAIVTINKNKDNSTGTGDGMSADNATFDSPQGLALTGQGLFIADSRRGPNVPANDTGRRTGLIRFINTTAERVTFYPGAASPIVVDPGRVATITGSLSAGNELVPGDGGPAVNARLVGPSDVAVSPQSGDIYIADLGHQAVRRVSRNTGVITSLGMPAARYTGLAFDSAGRLYVVDADAGRVLRETGAGSGEFARLDVPPNGLNQPRDVAVDASGNAYVTNSGDHRILKVGPDGAAAAFAGTTPGFGGDGGPAADAQISIAPSALLISASVFVPRTVGVTVSSGGDLFFADSGNNRVRRLSPLAATRAVASVSAASFTGASVAAESIVAGYGSGLATATETATGLPLPTLLAGTTVKIKDSAGSERLAPLFFVSPGQVNYLVPPGTTPGPAAVTITGGDGATSAGMIQIAAVAPGIFAANTTGQGVAAAVALRVRPDNSLSYEPVSRYDAGSNLFVPVPIDLGPDGEQVFLILYGTGIRYFGSLDAVTAQVGGAGAQVTFAGAQNDFVGLDQINLRLERSLTGRGDVPVAITVAGLGANEVRVTIK